MEKARPGLSKEPRASTIYRSPRKKQTPPVQTDMISFRHQALPDNSTDACMHWDSLPSSELFLMIGIKTGVRIQHSMGPFKFSHVYKTGLHCSWIIFICSVGIHADWEGFFFCFFNHKNILKCFQQHE